MQIHCAPCTTSQLAALKRGSIIPSSADQCGLITKSDVERLISYLKSSDLMDKDKNSIAEDVLPKITSPSPQKRVRTLSPSSPSRPLSGLAQENIKPTEIYENKKGTEDFPKAEGTKFGESYRKENDESMLSNACMEAIPTSPVHKQKETCFEKDNKVINRMFFNWLMFNIFKVKLLEGRFFGIKNLIYVNNNNFR